MFWRSKTVIALPVKNEEAHIGRCLQAMAEQTAEFDHILLLLNNCTDGTLAICEAFAKKFGKTQIVQRQLASPLATAGEARRLALRHALELAGEGIVLTTDADSVVPESWVADNLHAIEQGADLVCGMAELDLDTPIPALLKADAKNEARLLALHDEIAAIADPQAHDPWPRHQDHSGASLAMRAPVLRRAGGPPHVATGEDRALIERLALVDARIRHADIRVRVSGRLEGRAAAGMAATLKRRLQQRDADTDDRLEPTVDALRRVLARSRLRAVVGGREPAEALAEDLLILPGVMRRVLHARFLGAAFADLQRLSPVLQRRRVAFTDLQREIRQAEALRDELRETGAPVAAPPDGQGNLSSDESAR